MTSGYRSVWLLLLLLAGCATVQPVEKGGVYRSGPMSAEAMQHVINQENIRTVVNLRGFEPARGWYQQQRQVCDRLDVEYVDCSLNTESPEREEVLTLLETLQRARKPVLIQGDRLWRNDGFAAGLYRVEVLHESNDKARKELALWQRSGWNKIPLSGHDELLRDWESVEHFAASAPPVVSPQIAWARTDDVTERDEPEQSLWFEADNAVPQQSAEGTSHTSAKVDLWSNPVGDTIKKEAETIGQDFVRTIDHPSDYLASESGRVTECGPVFSDYSAFIVDGPVSSGPMLVGRTPRFLGKRRDPNAGGPHRSRKIDSPSDPKGPAEPIRLPPPLYPGLTRSSPETDPAVIKASGESPQGLTSETVQPAVWLGAPREIESPQGSP